MLQLKLWFGSVAVLAAFAGVANAQVGPGGGGPLGTPFACTVAVAVPIQVRQEGVSELVGDIILQCVGGGTPVAGSLVPTANITVSLGTNVTSRLLPNGGSEALLIVDEPASGLIGPGAALPQVVCESTAGASAAGCVGATAGAAGLYANLSGTSSSASQCTAFTGSTCTTFGPTPNVFVGTVSANQVTFLGIPVLPPVYTGLSRIFRITNVHANVAGFGVTNQLLASLAISGNAPVPINNPVQTVAFVQSGLSTSVRNTANSGPLSVASLQQCVSLPSVGSAPQLGATLRFSETFGTAFKTRIAATATTNGINGDPLLQNIPGVIYSSESGFVIPALGGTAGLSDSGTRLRAVFSNVPAGVNVFVTTTNYASASGLTNPTGNPPGGSPTFLSSALATGGAISPTIAQLVQSETTPDSGGSIPAVTPTTSIGIPGTPLTQLAQVTLVNGSGEAVWEVVQTNPNMPETLDFGVYFSYVGGAVGIGTGAVSLSYAPVVGGTSASATAPLPRFIDTSTPANVLAIASCTPNVNLTSSLEPSAWGQVVTLTATVSAASPGLPTPTGTVTFKDGSTTLGSAAVNAGGQAILSTSALAVGPHTITAVYSGDTNFPAATSGALTQMVNQASQTITFGTLGAQTYGAAPFTIGASASSGLPVSFSSGTPAVCTVTGSTVTILAAGSCSITASQAGNANYTSASDVTQNFMVGKAVLTVTANYATKAAGAALPSFTATISGFVNGDPLSVVNGAPILITAATTGSPAGNYAIVPSLGTLTAANYSFSFVNGTLVITAQPTVASTVDGNTPAPPNTFLGQSFTTPGGGVWTNLSFSFFPDHGLTPVAAGRAYLFSSPYSGTPSALAGLSGAPQPLAAVAHIAHTAAPAGFIGASIAISDGAYVFAQSVALQPNTQYFLYVDAPAGSFPGGVLTGGTGTGGFAANGSGASFAAAPAANFRLSAAMVIAPPPPPPVSEVTVSSSANPSALGQTVTFTATVSGSAGAPAGTVQFLDGGIVLATAGIGAGGQASFSTKALTIGSHAITASYSGGGGYPGAQASISQTVNALASTLSLTAAAGTAVYGQPVSLTAVVGPATPPTGFAAPTGEVSFYLAGSGPVGARTLLGSAVLNGASATFRAGNLGVGTWYLLAQYSGDGTWSSSVGQVAVTVSPALTSTSVSLLVSSGKPVLTAAVAAAGSGAVTPAGSVQFIDTTSQTVVANAPLVNGTATAPAALDALGRPIAARYSGDGNFQGSTSAALPWLTNAAVNVPAAFGADEMATMFGVAGLTGDTSGSQPLGTTLAGVTLKITDSAGTDRMAPLYGVFASTGQINFVIPGATAAGLAGVTLTLPGGGSIFTAIQVGTGAPGIFTANLGGQGVYAGQVIHVHADGSQTIADPAVWDAARQTYAADPIDLGPSGDRVYLVFYGTGLRHAGAVTATAGGTALPVLYFGEQGQFPGLDQVNVRVPSALAGAGLVNVTIAADGQSANTVTLNLR